MAKLCAISFITLILLPFTAPFPTYQLDRGRSHPYDALPKEFKNKIESDESLILPTDWQLLLTALPEISISPFVRSNQSANRALQRTILRL